MYTRALVPYATRAVQSGQYGRAARVIGMAYRRYAFRKKVAKRTIRGAITAYKAARTIGKGVRWYMKQKGTRRIKGSTAPGPAQDLYNDDDLPLGRQWITPINLPIRSADNPNSRRNNNIHMSGIKYCFTFNTLNFGNAKNLDVHFALVQLKGSPLAEGEWNIGDIRDKIQRHFFRERTPSVTDPDVKVRPFNPATALNPGYDFGKSCLSLATDAFTVIFHKKFPLYTRYTQGNVEGGKPYMAKREAYIKINKEFSFANNADVLGRNPLVFVVWCNTQLRDQWPNPYPEEINFLHIENRITTYWRNT